MIRSGERVFVDTGAWIALAVVRDAMHERATGSYDALLAAGARFFTSTAVVLETFTYLDRKGSRDLAMRWHESLAAVPRMTTLDWTSRHLANAVARVRDRAFHELSLVDATSFLLMKEHRIRVAFSFDTHFAIAGFRLVS